MNRWTLVFRVLASAAAAFVIGLVLSNAMFGLLPPRLSEAQAALDPQSGGHRFRVGRGHDVEIHQTRQNRCVRGLGQQAAGGTHQKPEPRAPTNKHRAGEFSGPSSRPPMAMRFTYSRWIEQSEVPTMPSPRFSPKPSLARRSLCIDIRGTRCRADMTSSTSLSLRRSEKHHLSRCFRSAHGICCGQDVPFS